MIVYVIAVHIMQSTVMQKIEMVPVLDHGVRSIL